MNKYIKQLMGYATMALAAVAVMVTLAAVPAMAIDEEYTVTTTSLDGGTNNVATVSTNTLTGPWMNWTMHDQVGLVVSFKGNNASMTGNVGFKLALAANTNLISTTGPGLVTFEVAANGTNTVVWMTNISVQTYGYGKLVQSYSTNAYSATNLVVDYVTKPIRTGYRW
jgi:hypothetical protein